MNYSEEVKSGLIKEELRRVCCSRALCCGMLLGATLEEEPPADETERRKKATEATISFRTEQREIAELLQRLLRERFGKEVEITEGKRPGHTVYALSFASKPVQKLLEALERGAVEPGERPMLFGWKCGECRTALLRGFFLGCGSLSDPSKSFHLEFRVPPARAAAILSLFYEEDEQPHACSRRDKTAIYYKKSAAIGDFFSSIGANTMYFSMLNHQIERQIRASENRATNCVMRNIEKTVQASLKQISAVKTLFITGEIERLPKELRETAILRLEYDDDSLKSLAERHVPPITKSGLTHRLRRIVEIADGLLLEQELKATLEREREEARKVETVRK